MKPTRRILEALDVMNVQATVTCGQIAGISSMHKERLSTSLSVTEEEEETLGKDPKFLAFTTSHNDLESKSYYPESSDEDDLKEAYKTLFIKFVKLRETHQKNVLELNMLKIEKNALL